MKKRCTKCLKKKKVIKFSSNKNNKDNLRYQCKKCDIKQSLQYQRTKEGIVKKIYNNQKYNSLKRGHKPPTYTQFELLEYSRNSKVFNELYDAWVISGYLKELSPSFDRLNDDKGYSFLNIQIITFEENNSKSHHRRKKGLENSRNKPIIQLTLDNLKIKEFHSAMEASRVTKLNNSHISACARGIRKSTGGFKWQYK